MASGDTLITFDILANQPPATAYATFDTRNNHPCLDFDAATNERAIFTGILPRNYAGGGITVYIHWAASTATADHVIWNASIERIGDQQLDIDADSFAAAQAVTADVPGTSGFVDIAAIAFTNGAQMDSLAVGELFRLDITRHADDGSDDAAGDAEVFAVEIKET